MKKQNYIKNTLKDSNQRISKTIPKKVLTRLREIKKDHIDSVLNDPICEELKRGASGSSKFLEEGDLFSFFGFKAGEDPVGALEIFLNQKIRFIVPSKVENFSMKSLVLYPSFEDFNQSRSLSLSWGGGSWPVRIEKGLPDLSRFISLTDKGRSLGGIQNTKSRGDTDWKGTPFISRHKKNFMRRIGNIKL